MRRLGKKLALMLCMSILGTMPAVAAEQGPGFRNGKKLELSSTAIIGAGVKIEGGQETGNAAAETETKQEAQSVQDSTKSAVEAKSLKKTEFKAGDTPFGTVVTEESKLYKRGESLGEFKIVAYYGDGKTYSGTTPTEHHTIAADLTVLPLGTKVFIGDTVYTVEDKGSAIVGKMIDIYYDTKEEAVGVTRSGAKSSELFAALQK